MTRVLVALGFVLFVALAVSPAQAQSVSLAGSEGPAYSLLANDSLRLQLESSEPSVSQRYTQGGGTHPDWGFVIAGSITLGVGYVTSAVFAALAENPILFIPVVGGAIHAPLNGTAGGWALGLSLFAVQTTGLILLIVGLVANIPDEEEHAASWTPRLAAGPGDAGLGLRWSF